MGKKLNLVSSLHKLTKRNYLERMINKKVICMKKARKFEFDFWDGKRKFGYGGYKYIPGRWEGVAQKMIKKYKLNNKSKVLDVGCGKGYLLFEMKKILPDLKVYGFDISKHAIKNAKKEVKKNLFVHDGKKTFTYKKKYFDFTFTLACLHNFKANDLEKSIKEIERVSKKSYIMVEGYRNEQELFNLQCWALTAETFFDDDEWKWMFKKCKYNGDFEFIYF
jgi:SAM-dependent methyltransferase